jgi:hypothetical protein
MKKTIRRIVKWINEPSPTSFGSHKTKPRWLSVICDYLCLFSFGLYRP